MRLTFQSKAAQSSHYRPDIDGLRAIAVLAVVFFHAHIPGFSGGYTGVDIFFVISGYLITAVLLNDFAQNRFSFLNFYDRRIRRIFPALAVVLLACTALGVVVSPPVQFTQYAQSLLAVCVFVSNIFFRSVGHTTGYFADTSWNLYLLHTWSLSVEEQFYVFFPILLYALRRVSTSVKAAILLTLWIASLAISIHSVAHSPVAAFYLLPQRAWELLTGALLSLNALPPVRSRALRELLTLSGLTALIYAITSFTDATPFPGTAALVPCLGAALLLYAGQTGTSAVSRVLALPPLVFIGAISYSLYLWHWPVLAASNFWHYGAPTPAQQWHAILAACLLAVASFLFIETPFRRRDKTTAAQRSFVTKALLANIALALLAAVILLTGGLPKRFTPSKAAALNANFLMAQQTPGFAHCVNDPVPATIDQLHLCTVGTGANKIFVWGDSHAGHMLPIFQLLHDRNGMPGTAALLDVAAGCTPVPGMQAVNVPYDCDARARMALQRASQPDVSTVLIVFSPWWTSADNKFCIFADNRCGPPLSRTQAWSYFQQQLTLQIKALQSQGKRVALTVPTPDYSASIPQLVNRNLVAEHFKLAPQWPVQIIPPAIFNAVRTLARATGASLFDPHSVLCTGESCIFQQNGRAIFTDGNHLSPAEAWRFEPALRQALTNPK